MSEAPSEKHLEDWIVNNFADFQYQSTMYFKYSARQIKLPSGRCDLLGTGWSMDKPCKAVCIAEIKKGTLDESSLLQLLRYLSDVQSIWDYCLEGIPSIGGEQYGFAESFAYHAILIGYNVDPKVIAAASAIGVHIVLYEYDAEADAYQFWLHLEDHTTTQQRCDASVGIIRSIVRDVYLSNIERNIPKEILDRAAQESPRQLLAYDLWRISRGES